VHSSNWSFFMARTAPMASPRIRRVFGHHKGYCMVAENTILGISFSESTPSAPSAANPHMSR
jgi:hypothetical protein